MTRAAVSFLVACGFVCWTGTAACAQQSNEWITQAQKAASIDKDDTKRSANLALQKSLCGRIQSDFRKGNYQKVVDDTKKPNGFGFNKITEAYYRGLSLQKLGKQGDGSSLLKACRAWQITDDDPTAGDGYWYRGKAKLVTLAGNDKTWLDDCKKGLDKGYTPLDD